MFPSPQQLPMLAPNQTAGAAPIKPLTPAPPARTASDIRYENTLSPYVRAKYGLAAGPPTSLTQLQQPRQSSGAAISAPAPTMSTFGPSGQHVQLPRLQPLQFGEGA